MKASIVTSVRLFADETAERMRALHALPDGRSAMVSSDTRLETASASVTAPDHG